MIKSVAAALAMSLLIAPAGLAQEPADEVVTLSNQVTAKVNGMVCDFCAQAVISMFGKDEAVETVEVDLDNGEIQIALKDGADISDQRVEELVTKSGYDLVEIVRPVA